MSPASRHDLTALELELQRILPRRETARRTRLLGIVNLTPDSFHDGGIDASPRAALERAAGLVKAGADALDLGAESSRPGAAAVSEREELDRLLPVLEGAVELGVPISVDTVKASVAREALSAGATIVNDISALTHDPQMASVCAEAGAAVVLMHRRGSARDMQTLTDYDDVVSETRRFLEERMELAIRSGVSEEKIVIDPGIGFAKTTDQNLEILRRLREYTALGRPVLLGASRKSFLSRFSDGGTETRLEGTLAVSVLGVLGGASILRVHDVVENLRSVRTTEAVLNAPTGAREREIEEKPWILTS